MDSGVFQLFAANSSPGNWKGPRGTLELEQHRAPPFLWAIFQWAKNPERGFRMPPTLESFFGAKSDQYDKANATKSSQPAGSCFFSVVDGWWLGLPHYLPCGFKKDAIAKNRPPSDGAVEDLEDDFPSDNLQDSSLNFNILYVYIYIVIYIDMYIFNMSSPFYSCNIHKNKHAGTRACTFTSTHLHTHTWYIYIYNYLFIIIHNMYMYMYI